MTGQVDDTSKSRSSSDNQSKQPFDNEKHIASVGLAELDAQPSSQIEKVQEVLHDEELLTPEEDKRLLRKIDWYTVPIMMSIYGMQYADKVSLSAGVIFGLREDTHLVANEYAWLTTIFYLGYLVAQPLLNYLMQRVNASRFLSILIVLWGAVVMCLAACNNFSSLMAVRFLLGAMEGGVTPGFMLIVSSWYKKSEQNSRQLLYLAMNTGFSVWTTVVIYFLAKRSEEQGGLSGWRVINLFLGGVTIFVGLLACAFLRLPSNAWWLSEKEKKAARARIVDNATGSGDTQKWKWDQVRDAFTDPTTYFIFFISVVSCIPNGGITTFQTIVYKSFGFTPLESILYQLPSYAMSVSWIFFCIGVLHFFPRLRFFFMCFTVLPAFVAVLTAGLLPSDPSYKWIKYGVYLMSILYALQTFLMWSLMPSIIAGRTKKTVVSTLTFVGYCTGNMIGPQVFRSNDAPLYRTGLVVTASMLALVFVLCLAWLAYLVWTNARRRKVLRDMGVSEEERILKNKINGELDMTDNKNIYFLYNY
ncbi:uncharacterized protein PFL1_01074 [Pseudozyma flocculosa PF-1]|uniref:Probable DAL5 - Allantoate and ureidosuccinate permease n=1 Tax=Pseudozyma flocculosa TaxID=84751 RepID=A0A5C3FBZ3_9BASI|nr:uncharacterized protein PFL1_01074 [Pseudozyma flocculosa PF-1]EPQ31742.1 hypothetical protein PFL1_01074 [Pseudozyma flocculosa PF-1]SPO41868.1 probable DAL5 - Allantoate and ureidosuccinate permease [Pseudozyma flocculosa]